MTKITTEFIFDIITQKRYYVGQSQSHRVFILSAEAPAYSIYAVTEQPVPETHFLRRRIWPDGNPHSFLMLVEEEPDGGKKPLAELHFSGKNCDGKFVHAGSKLFNAAAGLADMVGLEGIFRKAVRFCGLGKKLYPIRGVKVSPRSDFDTLVKFGGVTGTPDTIMYRWNRACAAALMINRANIPFTALASRRRGPVNCNSGTKTLLSILGDEFKEISQAFSWKRGRDLGQEVPALQRLRMIEPKVPHISFESLCRANDRLSKRLYETSRILQKQGGMQPQTPSGPA